MLALLLAFLAAQEPPATCRPLPPPVREALVWLARHQDPGGVWDLKSFPRRCAGGAPCGDGANQGAPEYQTGATSLSLLAFLGCGIGLQARDEDQGVKLGDALRAGVRALAKAQAKDGAIGDAGLPKSGYAQALAVQVLAEALRSLTAGSGFPEEEAAGLRRVLEAAVANLIGRQNPGAGWRYGYPGDNDSSVSAAALLALYSARLAGVRVPESSIEGGMAWFDKATEAATQRVGYNAPGSGKVFAPGKNEGYHDHPTMTAAAGVCRRLFGREVPSKGAQLVAKDRPDPAPNAVDFCYWYYGTRFATLSLEGTDRDLWKAGVARILTLSQGQEPGACSRGSWEPNDRWGTDGGRVYATAINALTLEYAQLARTFDFPPPPAPPAAWIFRLRSGGRIAAISYEETPEGYQLRVGTGFVKVLKDDVDQILKIDGRPK